MYLKKTAVNFDLLDRPVIKLLLYKISVICYLLICNIPLPAQTSSQNVDNFLKARMKYYKIPGMQVAIIKDGRIIKNSAYGTANIPFSIAVTPNTIFPINSMTKCFTGVVLMKLVENRQVKLDDTVADYLTNLPQVWRKITIKQLLTHTSGLPDIIDGDTGKMIAQGEDSIALAKVKSLPMRFTPGERSQYNQTNYVLLGQIIEKLSKKTFITYVAEHEFIPAQMLQTNFGDSFDVIKNMTETYSYKFNRNDLWKPTDLPTRVFEEFAILTRPASGINSTAGDLAKWLIDLTNGKFITPKSLETMWTPALHNDGTIAPRGLGWSVKQNKKHPVVYGTGGMRSAMYYYPEDKIGIIILTNLRGANPERIIEQLAGFYISDLNPYLGAGLSPDLKLLHSELLKNSYTKTLETYQELQLKDKAFKISEAAMNDWGYTLLHIGRKKEAIEIFSLNTKLYPNSGNTYDSLGEAYSNLGNKSMALKNYRLSLKYAPENTNAKQQIKILEKQINTP
ncbi:serine hydrolase [Elizabethkingia anophelis]|uniref:serine hydrolase n=1 Tax=Elizabethkingia anophelis TaxID=1117645 RepID=UPI00389199E1